MHCKLDCVLDILQLTIDEIGSAATRIAIVMFFMLSNTLMTPRLANITKFSIIRLWGAVFDLPSVTTTSIN